jgi:hypothetical protein
MNVSKLWKAFVSDTKKLMQNGYFPMMMLIFVAVMSMMMFVGAQTSNTFEIPVDDLFIQANTWIVALFPIFAIGGGISIAVVLLNFVIRQVVGAFRGGGG